MMYIMHAVVIFESYIQTLTLISLVYKVQQIDNFPKNIEFYNTNNYILLYILGNIILHDIY